MRHLEKSIFNVTRRTTTITTTTTTTKKTAAAATFKLIERDARFENAVLLLLLLLISSVQKSDPALVSSLTSKFTEENLFERVRVSRVLLPAENDHSEEARVARYFMDRFGVQKSSMPTFRAMKARGEV